MKLSIIIPIFNEERTVSEILRRVREVKLPFKISKELIIVDDGSSDGTIKILKKIKEANTKIFFHSLNKGKGAAVRTGLSKASGDLIIIQDADLEYNPQDFGKLLKPIMESHAEVVYGNRFENYPLILFGKSKTVLPTHWFGNKFLTLLTNILYGTQVSDMETCYKLFTKKAISKIDLKSDRFEIEPEITAKFLKAGIKINEVPINVHPRTHNEGKKISWKDGIVALRTLIKYRFIN